MKKLYSLVVLVALGALSGCVYHDHHHRDGHRPPPPHHGDYDRGDRGDRDYRHHR
jgi:hypothetical protein